MRNWQAPTRRTALFLALLAVTGPALHAEDAMNSTSSHFAYIGTYNPNGEGVYRVQVDPASGALSHTTLVSKVPNPAQLTLGADGKTLYVASEVADFNGGKHGGITAYRVNPADGGLTQLNQVDSQGRGRCISHRRRTGGICWWPTTSAAAWRLSRSKRTAAWAPPARCSNSRPGGRGQTGGGERQLRHQRSQWSAYPYDRQRSER